MVTADTNLFVYLFDSDAPAKRETARIIVEALVRRNAPAGVQCAGELQNVLRRKLKYPPWEAAQHARNLLVTFPGFGPTKDAALAALADMAAGQGQYFDRLLIYSAQAVGCRLFLTEDAQGAPMLGEVEIVNPFGSDGRLSDRARDVLEL